MESYISPNKPIIPFIEKTGVIAIKGLNGAIRNKNVTSYFERFIEGASLLTCSEFGNAIVDNM